MDFRSGGSRRWFQNCGVVGILCSGFRHLHFRTELVHHLVLYYREHILFISGDAVVVLVEMEDVGGEVGWIPPMWGRDFSTYSWINFPQLTGRTPDIAPNRVLAMVMLSLLGISILRIGKINSITLRSLGFGNFLDGTRLSGLDPSRIFLHESYLGESPILRPSLADIRKPHPTPLMSNYSGHA